MKYFHLGYITIIEFEWFKIDMEMTLLMRNRLESAAKMLSHTIQFHTANLHAVKYSALLNHYHLILNTLSD